MLRAEVKIPKTSLPNFKTKSRLLADYCYSGLAHSLSNEPRPIYSDVIGKEPILMWPDPSQLVTHSTDLDFLGYLGYKLKSFESKYLGHNQFRTLCIDLQGSEP